MIEDTSFGMLHTMIIVQLIKHNLFVTTRRRLVRILLALPASMKENGRRARIKIHGRGTACLQE